MIFSSTLLESDISNKVVEWVLVGALLGSQGEDIPGKEISILYHASTAPFHNFLEEGSSQWEGV